MPFIAGYKGRLVIDSAAGAMTLTLNRWSVDWVSDSMDVTSTENNAYEGFLSGVKDLTINFDGFFDTKANPFGGVIELTPGNYYSISLYYDKNDMGSNRWFLNSILCTEVHSETSVRDTVRYSFVGKFSEYRDDSPAFDGVLQQFNVLSLPMD